MRENSSPAKSAQLLGSAGTNVEETAREVAHRVMDGIHLDITA